MCTKSPAGRGSRVWGAWGAHYPSVARGKESQEEDSGRKGRLVPNGGKIRMKGPGTELRRPLGLAWPYGRPS